MTEEPNTPLRPAEKAESSIDDGGRDVAHAGGGRTAGETAVDDALGTGEDPRRA